MKRNPVRVILAMLSIAGFAAPAGAAPQTFNTALPVAEGEFVFRNQLFFKKAKNDPSAADRNVEVFGSVFVLGYGITGDLSVFGVLPYLDKRLRVTIPGGPRVTRDTNSIGDARLFARYTLFRDDAPGRTFRVALFAGIELPTGDSKDKDRIGRLPATLQIGSGSWDPFGGVVATFQTLDYQIDLQASHKLNTRANGFEYGDEARLDGSFQYRLWPRELEGGVPGFLYGILEGNLSYRPRNKLAGNKVGSSGGTSLFIAPGLQYVTQRWILEAIVQIPVFQDLNGTALKDSYTVRSGFRLNF
jgi:hypothetical protein